MTRVALLVAITLSAACGALAPVVGGTQTSEKTGSPNACSHVAYIKAIPAKPELSVDDEHYNNLRSNSVEAEECLVELITDATPMTDPRDEPTRVRNFVVGDLAFFLLTDFDLVPFEQVLPEEVQALLPQLGVLAYFQWVNVPGNREVLQQNCRDWLLASKTKGKRTRTP
jgi:hypothetical protein